MADSSYTRQRVLVAGGTGFLGRQLCAALVDRGDEVIILSRHPQPGGPSTRGPIEVLAWDPRRGVADDLPWVDALGRVDAVVNLAGENIGGRGPVPARWTPTFKDTLRSSLLQSARALLAAIEATDLPRRPQVLVNASATGYYGSRGETPLSEFSSPGTGFLASLCVEWEAAAAAAESLGLRVVRLRTGVVLDQGALASDLLVLSSRLGVAGPLGSGRQWWPWIHRHDVVGLLLHALHTETLDGPVNAVAPAPRRMRDFPHVLGHLLHRPACVPAPALALRLALGELADALLLASQYVVPARALDSGYGFRFQSLEDAFEAIVGEGRGRRRPGPVT